MIWALGPAGKDIKGDRSAPSIHSFHKYALGICGVTGTVLDLERHRNKQMAQVPALTELPV